MWPITEGNIVRRMYGPEGHPLIRGEVREYIRTEWNGDGGAVLRMIAEVSRNGKARRRRRTAGPLQRFVDGIRGLMAGATTGRA
jgi:hypothetical protein